MRSFRTLADLFQDLEHTRSSSKLITVLAAFLRSLRPEEAAAVAYLLQGEISAPYAGIEFGMAERLVAEAIAQAYDSPVQRVRHLLSSLGDLGSVAEHLRPGGVAHSRSILRVLASLRAIAALSGGRSQAAKCSALASLLTQCSGIEAKYLVRTVLGSQRLGVADMTYLRALAKAYATADDRQAIEAAYNILSDLGEVTRRLARGGMAALRHLSPQPGIPVRMMLAGRARDLREIAARMHGPMLIEHKYDGERVQIHRDRRGRLLAFSRRATNITDQYPEVIEAIARSGVPNGSILEGEVVAFDPRAQRLLPFQQLMQRRRKHHIDLYVSKVRVALFAFDLLLVGHRSLLSTPLLQRRALLQQHCRPGGLIHLSECIVGARLADLRRCFTAALAAGAEGLVVKAASGPYQAGRRGSLWIKYKRDYQAQLTDSFDLVIVGAMRGRGRRAGAYGSLLLAAFDPADNHYYSLTKVGAGLSDRLLGELPALLRPLRLSQCHPLVDTGIVADLWFRPVKVVEVRGADLTLSPVHTVARSRLHGQGLALRFPRFVRLRDDKSAEQATSVAEIYRMYRSAVHPRQRTNSP